MVDRRRERTVIDEEDGKVDFSSQVHFLGQFESPDLTISSSVEYESSTVDVEQALREVSLRNMREEREGTNDLIFGPN